MSIIDLKSQVQIIDYAEYIGFHPYRVGRWYSLKEHDSVRIDPVKNLFYRNSTGESGSVIDFIMAFKNIDFNGAAEELKRYAKSDGIRLATLIHHETERIKRETKVVLPEKDNTYKNVYAYLTKTRMIDKSVVDWMVAKQYLYQDIHKNCVFVSRKDGVPVFASLRGTNTYKRFVADASGSDYSYGLFFQGSSDKEVLKERVLCIFESAIDMMSYLTISIALAPYMDYEDIISGGDYLVLSGVSKKDAIWEHLKDGKYDRVFISLDNDDAGRKASSEISKELYERGIEAGECFPFSKDWNEELLGLIKDRGKENESIKE